MLVNKVPTNWNERNSIRKVFEVKCSAKLDNRLIRICIYTWTKIITVKPRANQTIRFSFMYSTNFSLHPVFLASLMVHVNDTGAFGTGQHVYGNLFCPNIGYQSAGSFTPQHLFCNQFAYLMKSYLIGHLDRSISIGTNINLYAMPGFLQVWLVIYSIKCCVKTFFYHYIVVYQSVKSKTKLNYK